MNDKKFNLLKTGLAILGCLMGSVVIWLIVDFLKISG